MPNCQTGISSQLRLGVIGPMMGRTLGYVITQELILADYFAGAGYPVICASTSTSRYIRLLDIIYTLFRHRHSVDVLILGVYGGRSFIVEDISSRLGKLFGHRIIMVLRGGAMPEFMARFPSWTRRVLSRANVLVAPSGFLRHAVAPYGYRAEVIPNTLNLQMYPYRHRCKISPKLFWMRSLHSNYNPLMAIRVLAGLRAKFPEATLVMAGQDMGCQAATVRCAEELGVKDALRLTGFLDMSAKVREGDRADIFINTNHVDNMPVAVLEAAAMGLPVVATSVGGIPFLLQNEETGLLVPNNDQQAMIAAIERLLFEPSLTAHISANGRKLAESSSWEVVQVQWENIFADVMTQSPKGRKGTR